MAKRILEETKTWVVASWSKQMKEKIRLFKIKTSHKQRINEPNQSSIQKRRLYLFSHLNKNTFSGFFQKVKITKDVVLKGRPSKNYTAIKKVRQRLTVINISFGFSNYSDK